MSSNISEFIGVYDADATLVGELTYWLGARFGVRHCSLCDITHGLFTERGDWKRCRGSLGVRITTFRSSDSPPDVLEVANGVFPCVVARGAANQLTVVLGPDDLEALDGSPEALVDRLNELIA